MLILYTIFFCGFGIEMVELPLIPLALATTEEKKKEAARKADDKRNARRGALPGVGRAKPMLRSGSYGELPRASAAPRPQQSSRGSASALAETQVALKATIACLNVLGKERKLPAPCARCSSQTAPASAEPLAELLERMERCDRRYLDDDAALACWTAEEALRTPSWTAEEALRATTSTADEALRTPTRDPQDGAWSWTYTEARENTGKLEAHEVQRKRFEEEQWNGEEQRKRKQQQEEKKQQLEAHEVQRK